MRKPDFYLCKNKGAVTAQLISVFDTRIVKLLSFLYLKFKASSVGAQAGFFQTWSETPKTGFLGSRLN